MRVFAERLIDRESAGKRWTVEEELGGEWQLSADVAVNAETPIFAVVILQKIRMRY